MNSAKAATVRVTGTIDDTCLLSRGWLLLAQALDTLLARAAGPSLRQRGEPLRLDRLAAELAGAVGSVVHPFECCGEAIDAARESLPLVRDELHVLTLSGLVPYEIELVGRGGGPDHSDLIDRSVPFTLEALSNPGLGIPGHSCLREGGR